MVITMSKYKDLAERLRGKPPTHSTLDRYEAADAIEALYTRIEKLEAALKPFAYYAEQIPNDVSDTASASGTVGDLRTARKVLGEKE